jgi:proteasome accessory factor A
LALDDPLLALHTWSRDVSLTARVRLATGGEVTAIDLQRRFLDDARALHASGGCEGIVPESERILEFWEDTLNRLRDRDFETLARRIDWVLKRDMLQRTIAAHPHLSWTSPEIRYLDQMYASIDESDGLFWAQEAAGLVDTWVTDAEIARATAEPPEDTRAWTRAHLLRRLAPRSIELVDWDRVVVRGGTAHGLHRWWAPRTIHLPCPYEFTRSDHEQPFGRGRALENVASDPEEETPRTGVPVLPARYTVS